MDKPESYENVMRELEEINDEMECENCVDITNHLDDNHRDFKFEYAFESLTEKSSAYKRRTSNA